MSNLGPLQTNGATEATLEEIQAQYTGIWSYYAGVSGTVSVTGRVLGITAITVGLAATVSINGGPNIPLPRFVSVEITPKTNLVNPTVVFTNTDSYLIEVLN